jgi:hypothetical protein
VASKADGEDDDEGVYGGVVKREMTCKRVVSVGERSMRVTAASRKVERKE